MASTAIAYARRFRDGLRRSGDARRGAMTEPSSSRSSPATGAVQSLAHLDLPPPHDLPGGRPLGGPVRRRRWVQPGLRPRGWHGRGLDPRRTGRLHLRPRHRGGRHATDHAPDPVVAQWPDADRGHRVGRQLATQRAGPRQRGARRHRTSPGWSATFAGRRHSNQIVFTLTSAAPDGGVAQDLYVWDLQTGTAARATDPGPAIHSGASSAACESAGSRDQRDRQPHRASSSTRPRG